MNWLIEFLLLTLDGVLDVLTFSRWTCWQERRVPNIRVVKGVEE